MKPHYFSPEILKESDIRGKIGKDINIEDAHFVGRPFDTRLKRMKIHQCVGGWDGRLLSPVQTGGLKKISEHFTDSKIYKHPRHYN